MPKYFQAQINKASKKLLEKIEEGKDKLYLIKEQIPDEFS